MARCRPGPPLEQSQFIKGKLSNARKEDEGKAQALPFLAGEWAAVEEPEIRAEKERVPPRRTGYYTWLVLHHKPTSFFTEKEEWFITSGGRGGGREGTGGICRDGKDYPFPR